MIKKDKIITVHLIKETKIPKPVKVQIDMSRAKDIFFTEDEEGNLTMIAKGLRNGEMRITETKAELLSQLKEITVIRGKKDEEMGGKS